MIMNNINITNYFAAAPVIARMESEISSLRAAKCCRARANNHVARARPPPRPLVLCDGA